MEKYRPGAQDL